jgi:hypothetical protein
MQNHLNSACGRQQATQRDFTLFGVTWKKSPTLFYVIWKSHRRYLTLFGAANDAI